MSLHLSRAARLLPLLLLALLLACCPVPAASATDTAFAGRIVSVSAGHATAALDSGREVALTLYSGTPSGLVPGARVYVEGVLEGATVLVRRIAVL